MSPSQRGGFSDGRRFGDETASPKHGAVDPKTEPSKAGVWIPDKLSEELATWMDSMDDKSPEAFIFASEKGTPANRNNFFNRNIKSIVAAALKARGEAGKETPKGYLAGVNPQAFRRTCATWAQEGGTLKDAQAMLRRSSPDMTGRVYMQEVPESVRRAVEALDEKLRSLFTSG